MDIPNVLSTARLGVAIVTALLVTNGSTAALWVAFILHFVIYASDVLDGKIARARDATRRDGPREAGRLIDSSVDSLVFSVIAVALVSEGLLIPAAGITVVSARFILMGVRAIAAATSGTSLPPTNLTKLSGGVYGVGSVLLLLSGIYSQTPIIGQEGHLWHATQVATIGISVVAVSHYIGWVIRPVVREWY